MVAALGSALMIAALIGMVFAIGLLIAFMMDDE